MDCFSQEKRADHQSVCAGFSRLDLLAVLAVVGVLFLLTAAGVANDGNSSESTTCVQNHKQLIRAWQLYAEDNDGRLASNMSRNANITNWVGGILSYESREVNWSTEYVSNPRHASLGPYVKQAEFFHCPGDSSSVPKPRQSERVPRNRSYSMNGAIGNTSSPLFSSSQYRLYNRLSDLVRPLPQGLFVFIDEHPDSIDGSDFWVDMDHVNNPQTAWWFDLPAAFHNGAGAMSFADGHVEVYRWGVVSTRQPVRYSTFPGMPVGPDGRDYRRVAERTSAVTN